MPNLVSSVKSVDSSASIFSKLSLPFPRAAYELVLQQEHFLNQAAFLAVTCAKAGKDGHRQDWEWGPARSGWPALPGLSCSRLYRRAQDFCLCLCASCPPPLSSSPAASLSCCSGRARWVPSSRSEVQCCVHCLGQTLKTSVQVSSCLGILVLCPWLSDGYCGRGWGLRVYTKESQQPVAKGEAEDNSGHTGIIQASSLLSAASRLLIFIYTAVRERDG